MCVNVATAGELLRRELAAGASELGLAKKIAGSDDGAHPDVQSLRFVVRRASAGSEPNTENAKRIEAAFGVKVDPPRTSTRRREDLGEEVRKIVDRLDALTRRVRALERRRPA